MAKREIIQIDEEKCDGCGLCITGCAEGALAIVDGKARLVSDIYCDGLGACLSECPNDALKIIVREAQEFDEEAVEEMMTNKGEPGSMHHENAGSKPEPLACGCPGSMVQELKPLAVAPAGKPGEDTPSALQNWPVQLHLVPTKAPFFQNADVLIAADCAGFSVTALHRDHLPGKSLIIACPKLDETSGYQAKLAEIFRNNGIKSTTVLYMTVPCCFGLVHLVKSALKDSGQAIDLRLIKVDPQGQVVEDECLKAA